MNEFSKLKIFGTPNYVYSLIFLSFVFSPRSILLSSLSYTLIHPLMPFFLHSGVFALSDSATLQFTFVQFSKWLLSPYSMLKIIGKNYKKIQRCLFLRAHWDQWALTNVPLRFNSYFKVMPKLLLMGCHRVIWVSKN